MSSGLLPDWMIQRDVKIEPFAPQPSRPGVISYGVTSYGYDVRVGRNFKVFTNVCGAIVDPKHFDPRRSSTSKATTASSRPTASRWPRRSSTSKSRATCWSSASANAPIARCGIIVNVTPLEPEWRGQITIEISNTTPLPAKIYAGEGIAQILFFRGAGRCKTSYADKKGKYQDQKGLTTPIVSGDK